MTEVSSDPGLARRAHDLDLLFAPRDEGYVGADVGLSIPLGDGRTLWVFGDTLVGTCRGNSRHWTSMPRNSVAIQPNAVPDPGAIVWLYHDRSGIPSTFFQLPDNAEGEWFWPGTGCMIGSQLFVFGYGVVSAPSECEALAFRIVRQWLFRVSDVSARPADWKYTASPMNLDASDALYASACLVRGDHLYLLGMTRKRDARRCSGAVLARVSTDDLIENGATCKLEFWSHTNSGDAWTSVKSSAPQIIFEPGVTEASLYYDAPRQRYLATTYRGRNPEFLLSCAPELTGPWSDPITVFRCSEGVPSENHLFYTFRMHPQLAGGSDEMVFSYVVNARDPADLKTDTAIYYPRFIRLDLRGI